MRIWSRAGRNWSKLHRGDRSIWTNKLRRIDENNNFIEREVEHGNRTVFDDDIKFAIEGKEAIAVTDASINNGIMAGAWKIEDEHECVSMCGRSWYRNWNKTQH